MGKMGPMSPPFPPPPRRAAAGAGRALEAPPRAAAGAGGAAAGAGAAVPADSMLTGLPILSPCHAWISKPRMMMSLVSAVCRLSKPSLLVLDSVCDKVGKLDHDVLVERLVLDEVVQLGREHRLDKVHAV